MPRTPGSGRKKGTKNKNSIPALELADKLGINPLEILLRFAAGDWKGLGYQSEVFVVEKAEGEHVLGYTIKPELRVAAGKEAVKYIHNAKQAIAMTSSGETGIKVVIEDYTKKKEPDGT